MYKFQRHILLQKILTGFHHLRLFWCVFWSVSYRSWDEGRDSSLNAPTRNGSLAEALFLLILKLEL